MTTARVPREELLTYHQAALGVISTALAVDLRHLDLDGTGSLQGRAEFAGINQQVLAKGKRNRNGKVQVENFITGLLSGTVGRLIRVEADRVPPGDKAAKIRLEMKCLKKVRKAVEPKTDLAFGLAFAWLDDEDGGDTEATVSRLWLRANQLLRSEPYHEQLDRLVRELRIRRRMASEEILDFLRLLRPS